MDAKKVYEVVGAGKLRRTEAEFKKEFDAIMRNSASAWRKFNALDDILETFGVESIGSEDSKNRCEMCYLNVGDPYVPTLVLCGVWKYPIKLAQGGYASYVKGA